MPATSGLIKNNGANPATSVLITTTNDDTAATLVLEIEVFGVFGSVATKTGLAHFVFSVAPLTALTRTVNLTGVPYFEVQFNNISGTANAAASVFPIDAKGNLVDAERELNTEGTAITALTPIP